MGVVVELCDPVFKLIKKLVCLVVFLPSISFAITDSSGTFNNSAPVNGLSYAVQGQYAQNIGTNATNVMVGVFGQAVNTKITPNTAQHGLGVLGLAQDISSATASMIGVEGRTIGVGMAPQYTGVLGFGDYRGTVTTSTIIGVEARVAITSNGSAGVSAGTMQQLLIPPPVGKGLTDSSSWAMYGSSTYNYYMNGNVGISSANPTNKFVVKTTNAIASIGEPVGGVSAITFENGPITTSNYNMAGSGGHVFLNRPTGGSLYISENNSAQIIVSPTSGNMTSIGGFSGTFTSTPLVLGSTVTASSQLNLPAKTVSQLSGVSPSSTGQVFYCSDCTTAVICVSTGTAPGSFSSSSNRATVCQ